MSCFASGCRVCLPWFMAVGQGCSTWVSQGGCVGRVTRVTRMAYSPSLWLMVVVSVGGWLGRSGFNKLVHLVGARCGICSDQQERGGI